MAQFMAQFSRDRVVRVRCFCLTISIFFSSILLIRNHMIFRVQFGGGVGAMVRSLPSNPKIPGSIPGSAETGIFGDLLSR